MKQSLSLSLLLLLTVFLGSCRQRETPHALAFEADMLELKVGEAATPRLLNVPKGAQVSWSISDPGIASVTEGTVTALAEGNTLLTASVRGDRATLRIAVLPSKERKDDLIRFADKNFLRLILLQHPEADSDHDGAISREEALSVTSMLFGHDPQTGKVPEDELIADIEGIQYFSNLDTLDLTLQPVGRNSRLIEGLAKLRFLRIGYARISELNTGGMLQLEDLRVFGNPELTNLDLRNNTRLVSLLCQDTGLTELTLSGLSALRVVSANRSKIAKIRFGSHPEMERIDIVENQLSGLEVAGMPKLRELHANSNRLNTVRLTDLPALQRLNLYNNKLKGLDLQGDFQELLFLFLFQNEIASLDLKQFPKLFKLMVSMNPMTVLDLSSNKNIREVTAEDMPLLEIIDLKNGAYDEEAQYEVAEGNDKIKTIVVDAGPEEAHLKNVFRNHPKVQIVTEHPKP